MSLNIQGRHTFTKMEEAVFVCNDCGAHADKTENIKHHHDSCIEGEAEYWEKYYEAGHEDIRDEESSGIIIKSCLKEEGLKVSDLLEFLSGLDGNTQVKICNG